MRRRLTTIYVLLLMLVLAALEVPLAITLAGRATQRLAADRLADATRFATLAEPALRSGELVELRAELARYHEVYGIDATVVDRERAVMASSNPQLPPTDGQVGQPLRRALNGEQATGGATVWPWSSAPYVVAVPVGSGGETLGAVVIVSPTGQVRAGQRTTWLVLAAGGLLALGASVAAGWTMARWTLKPVGELDAAVHHIDAGDYAARVPADRGPPELRRLAVAFNDMAAAVADALERQRSFVAHASHQLRNPLTALRLRVEELAEEMTSPAGRAEHELALREADRLAEILDGLLALARAERGRYRVADVDAAAVAADRIAAWQPLADHRHITLEYRPTPAPVTARAVSTALDQALDALIDNALKFAGPGGKVRVRVGRAGGGVAVHVTDDGPGLDEEQREKATDRFWRAPQAQNVPGSGLGLPIVAVLVDASGGRLELTSAVPRGLDARVWLPAGAGSP